MPRKLDVEKRVRAYLDGPRYTLWTFIKYFESSKDPSHARSVKRQMTERLRAMVSEGQAATCRSIRRGRSYRRIDQGSIPF